MSSSALPAVRLPAVSQIWQRIRRLLALAFIAVVGFAVATATAAPHLAGALAVRVEKWMSGLTALDVLVGLVVLLGIAIVVAVATAIDAEEKREWFDVR